jgi:hypothetical protein
MADPTCSSPAKGTTHLAFAEGRASEDKKAGKGVYDTLSSSKRKKMKHTNNERTNITLDARPLRRPDSL